jgi:hypothetical protein
MSGSRSRYGLAVSALGALVLAIAVFVPWYGVSFTASGVAGAQRVSEQVAGQYGNAAMQSAISSVRGDWSSLVGREITSLSAHQALSTTNVVLLVLAGLACLIALFALAGANASGAPPSDASRFPLAALGLIACACVLFRMVDPPTPQGGFLALSLREGSWIALLGAIALLLGALWPGGGRRSSDASGEVSPTVWAELSGWTPES